MIRVFIGAGPEHKIPAEVLKHSILSRTERDVEITLLSEVEKTVPIPKKWKRWAPTGFSFQRFLIPEACGYQGKGIYLDSDMLVFGDIGELWDTPFPEDATILNTGGWQSAVMLIDCEKTRWQIKDLCGQLDAKTKNYGPMCNLKYEKIAGALNEYWNFHDRSKLYKQWNETHDALPPECRLLHYTDLAKQPWDKNGASHQLEFIWRAELLFALDTGAITKDDVMEAVRRQDIRPSIAGWVGEVPPMTDAQFVSPLKRRRRK